jgi:hypothetical protein
MYFAMSHIPSCQGPGGPSHLPDERNDSRIDSDEENLDTIARRVPTIPEAIREELDLHEGDHLVATVEDGRLDPGIRHPRRPGMVLDAGVAGQGGGG